jgi:hypothetical protein
MSQFRPHLTIVSVGDDRVGGGRPKRNTAVSSMACRFLMREIALPLFGKCGLVSKRNSSEGERVDFRTTAARASEASEGGGGFL